MAFEVTYQLNLKDIEAVQGALFRPAWGARNWGRHEILRRVLAGMSISVMFVLLVQTIFLARLQPEYVLASALLGGGLVWLWGRKIKVPPDPDNLLSKTLTLSLEHKGVRIDGDGFENFIDWKQIIQLRRAGGCLLFATRVTENIIVPLRAFEAAEAADAFCLQADVLLQSACNPPEAMPLERIVFHLLREDVRACSPLIGGHVGWRGVLPYALWLAALFTFGLFGTELSEIQWWMGLASSLGIAWLLTRCIWLLDRKLKIARFPLPEGNVEIQRWGNHLRITVDGKTKSVAYTSIGKVVITQAHIFLMTTPNDVIIVPRSAFSSASDMLHFAQAVDKAAEENQP
ncbi:MAG: YcxB family protein [Rhodoferax sp.]|nr:YcxB family protein [Rhodoferax sp.]